MARPIRIEFGGALYHVTARRDRRQTIFEDDADRERFLQDRRDLDFTELRFAHETLQRGESLLFAGTTLGVIDRFGMLDGCEQMLVEAFIAELAVDLGAFSACPSRS